MGSSIDKSRLISGAPVYGALIITTDLKISGLIIDEMAATEDPASCPTSKSIYLILRALNNAIMSVLRFNNLYSDISLSKELLPPVVKPYPLISGARTLKPSLAKSGIIFLQLKLNSGKP